MEDKDLGDGIEKFEEEIENLKNAKMKLFGITMTPTTIGAAFAIMSSIIGGLYASFQVYDDYMGMKEIVQNIDIEAIQSANELQMQKLEDAISYTQDIKTDLKQDIVNIDNSVNRIEGKSENTADHVRNLKTEVFGKIDAFEERLRVTLKENQDTINQIQKDITASIREIEGNNRLLEKDLRESMRTLEIDMSRKLQEALDNPLTGK